MCTFPYIRMYNYNYGIHKVDKQFNQGDQTGRIFAHWAIVYLRQLLENILIRKNGLCTVLR
jgi:hypothetical protein